MKKNVFKYLIILSIICYVLAHILPVYSTSNDSPEYFQGLLMNLLGGLLFFGDIHMDFFIWCANPLYLITLLLMAMSKVSIIKSDPSILNLIMSTLAAVLGLQFIWSREILLDEAGHYGRVETLYIGYWLWEAALLLLPLALWIRRCRKGSEDNHRG